MDTLIATLPTAVIGCIALYIAYQQWRTNYFKLQVDLYDRRLEVYKAVINYLEGVQGEFKVEHENLSALRERTAEADFLFGPDIREYLQELVRHGARLHRWNVERRGPGSPRPPGYDHKKVLDGAEEERQWFMGQHVVARQKFKRYMDVVQHPWSRRKN